jgi:hypothetical protein
LTSPPPTAPPRRRRGSPTCCARATAIAAARRRQPRRPRRRRRGGNASGGVAARRQRQRAATRQRRRQRRRRRRLDALGALERAVAVGERRDGAALGARVALAKEMAPLFDAAAKGLLVNVRTLVKLNPIRTFEAATLDQGRTVLHLAVDGGHIEIVTWLLGYKRRPAALVHRTDVNGLTALHISASYAEGRDKVTRLLVRCGSDAFVPAGARHSTALHDIAAAKWLGEESAALLDDILGVAKADAEIGQQDGAADCRARPQDRHDAARRRGGGGGAAGGDDEARRAGRLHRSARRARRDAADVGGGRRPRRGVHLSGVARRAHRHHRRRGRQRDALRRAQRLARHGARAARVPGAVQGARRARHAAAARQREEVARDRTAAPAAERRRDDGAAAHQPLVVPPAAHQRLAAAGDAQEADRGAAERDARGGREAGAAQVERVRDDVGADAAALRLRDGDWRRGVGGDRAPARRQRPRVRRAARRRALGVGRRQARRVAAARGARVRGQRRRGV